MSHKVQEGKKASSGDGGQSANGVSTLDRAEDHGRSDVIVRNSIERFDSASGNLPKVHRFSTPGTSRLKRQIIKLRYVW